MVLLEVRGAVEARQMEASQEETAMPLFPARLVLPRPGMLNDSRYIAVTTVPVLTPIGSQPSAEQQRSERQTGEQDKRAMVLGELTYLLSPALRSPW
jgi:hypothetical protein